MTSDVSSLLWSSCMNTELLGAPSLKLLFFFPLGGAFSVLPWPGRHLLSALSLVPAHGLSLKDLLLCDLEIPAAQLSSAQFSSTQLSSIPGTPAWGADAFVSLGSASIWDEPHLSSSLFIVREKPYNKAGETHVHFSSRTLALPRDVPDSIGSDPHLKPAGEGGIFPLFSGLNSVDVIVSYLTEKITICSPSHGFFMTSADIGILALIRGKERSQVSGQGSSPCSVSIWCLPMFCVAFQPLLWALHRTFAHALVSYVLISVFKDKTKHPRRSPTCSCVLIVIMVIPLKNGFSQDTPTFLL